MHEIYSQSNAHDDHLCNSNMTSLQLTPMTKWNVKMKLDVASSFRSKTDDSLSTCDFRRWTILVQLKQCVIVVTVQKWIWIVFPPSLWCVFFPVKYLESYVLFSSFCFREWKTYFKDPYNYFDLLGLILTFLVTPLRFAKINSQWSVAGLGYLFNFLKLFRFSCLSRYLSPEELLCTLLTISIWVKNLFPIFKLNS